MSRAYAGRTFVRERTIQSGDRIDVDLYTVFQQPGVRRSRSRPTREVQARINQRDAERKLLWLLRANFGQGDQVVHLTYRRGEEPADAAAAQKELYNFLRRLKRERKKRGLPELKYISCTEQGKKGGRLHHHAVISGGMSRDEVEKLWKKGYANARRIQWGEDGAAGLAVYLAEFGGRKPTYRRWNRSRNLTTPEPDYRDGAVSVAELRELAEETENGMSTAAEELERRYPGYEVTQVEVSWNSVNLHPHIRFELRRISGGPRRAAGGTAPSGRGRRGGRAGPSD